MLILNMMHISLIIEVLMIKISDHEHILILFCYYMREKTLFLKKNSSVKIMRHVFLTIWQISPKETFVINIGNNESS